MPILKVKKNGVWEEVVPDAVAENTAAIETLNGNASTEGSVDKKIADAISSANLGQYATDAELSAVTDRVATLEKIDHDAYKAADTALKNSLATVATTGKYSDLSGTPTIPTKTSQLTNDSGFKTTDNNTTYTLTKSGTEIVLTGSDGSKTSVTDSVGESGEEYGAAGEGLGLVKSGGDVEIDEGIISVKDTFLEGRVVSGNQVAIKDVLADPYKVNVTARSKNLFDGAEDGHIDLSDGQAHANAIYKATSYIPIMKGVPYGFYTEGMTNAGKANIFYYDSNKNYLGYGAVNMDGFVTFTPPANTAFIRAVCYAENINKTYLYENCTQAADYVPYVDITAVKSRNLIPYPYAETSKTVSGMTYTVNADGSIKLNGTATAQSSLTLWEPDNFVLGVGDSIFVSGMYVTAKCEKSDGSTIFVPGGLVSSNSIKKILKIYIDVAAGLSLSNYTTYPMLNYGNTALPFEKYFEPRPLNLKSCGKNLLPNTMSSYKIAGLTITVNSDKSITVNGTATQDVYPVVCDSITGITKGKSYVLSGCPAGGGNTYRVYITDSYRVAPDVADTGSSRTFVAQSTAYKALLAIYSGTKVNNLTFYPQIELGDTATEYEPYKAGETVAVTNIGDVLSFKSISPNMTLYPDANGVVLTANYNSTLKSLEKLSTVRADDNALGMVESGGDVNIKEGVITVKDKIFDGRVVSGNQVVLKDVMTDPYSVKVTARSKNLIETIMPTSSLNGITCTNNGDGSFTLNGTATANATFRINQSTLGNIDNLKNYSGTYTMSLRDASGNDVTTNGLRLVLMTYPSYTVYLQTVEKSTQTIDIVGAFVYILCPSGIVLNNVTVYPQLEEGDTATEWTPYVNVANVESKNLLAYPYVNGNLTVNGITFTDNGNGTITANGTATAAALYLIKNVQLVKGFIYTLDSGIQSSLNTCSIRSTDGVTIYATTGTEPVQFTPAADGTYSIYARINPGEVVTNLTFYPMLNKGSIAQPFVKGYAYSANLLPYPYYRSTATINGSTFTPQDDGGIALSGTPTGYNGYIIYNAKPIFKGVVTFSLQGTFTNAVFEISLLQGSTKLLNKSVSSLTVNFDNYPGCDSVGIAIKRETDNTAMTGTVYPMINAGGVALPYQKYIGLHPLSVTSHGKNLIKYPYGDTTKTTSGITFTNNGDGSITINGTASAHTWFNLDYNTTDLIKGATYTLYSNGSTSTSCKVHFSYFKADDSIVYYAYSSTTPSTFVLPDDYSRSRMYIQVDSGTTLNNVTIHPQLELGDTATEWTPYQAGDTLTLKDADDTVTFKSLAPSMELISEVDGVILDCEYNSTVSALDVTTEDLAKKVNIRRSVVGQTNNTTNPWYKFASVVSKVANEDKIISFKVHYGFGDGNKGVGILTAHARMNEDKTFNNGQLTWEYAGESIVASDYVLAYKSVAEGTEISLWTKISNAYNIRHFEVLSESDRINFEEAWTLYNTVSAGSEAAIPSDLTQYATSVLGKIINNVGGLDAKSAKTHKHTVSHTPAGTVSTPTITVTPNTTTVNSITAVGTLPSLSTSVTNRCLTLTWNAGTLPTKGANTTVATGIKSATATQPTFTGTAATLTTSAADS